MGWLRSDFCCPSTWSLRLRLGWRFVRPTRGFADLALRHDDLHGMPLCVCMRSMNASGYSLKSSTLSAAKRCACTAGWARLRPFILLLRRKRREHWPDPAPHSPVYAGTFSAAWASNGIYRWIKNALRVGLIFNISLFLPWRNDLRENLQRRHTPIALAVQENSSPADVSSLHYPITLQECKLLSSQGICTGGEVANVATYLAEHADKHILGMMSASVGVSGGLGFLCSSSIVLIMHLSLSDEEVWAWGQRIVSLLLCA